MTVLKNVINMCRDIYADRRLLVDLSLKDTKKRFSGTYLGVLWGLLQPLMTVAVYWAAFQYGFRSGDVGETPFALWFISGIIVWLFISEAFTNASNSLIEYSYLIQKVKFNVSILPLVKIFSSFYIHLLFLILVILICSGFGFIPTIMLLQILYYMCATIVLVLGMSLLTSSIMIFVRDLNQFINIILLIGMWGTPIAWDMSYFPENVQRILKLNPFYYLVEGYRDAILGRRWFWERPALSLYFWVLTILIFLIGATIFKKLKPHFADTV